MTGYLSLRWRIAALIAIGSIATAAIVAAGFSWLDLRRSWKYTNTEVVAIGNIVADQLGPAVTLGDRQAAAEILGSLRADGLLREAVLYDESGRCLAEFRRSGAAHCPPRPLDGTHRMPGSLMLCRPVEAGGARVGTLLLSAAVPSPAELVRQYLGGAVLILLMSFTVAAFVAMVLQSSVSTPILAIARVAKKITATHQFEERVRVRSSDELGVLAGSFNTMLDEIARRDRELEAQVVERSAVATELRLAKEKAEESTRLKSEFLANMSHEIRTPLNGVIGMLSLMLDHCPDAELRDQLQIAQTASQSLVTILNDILDLSKLEAGKMTVESIEFAFEGPVRDSVLVFESAAREKGLVLNLALSPDCPAWVRGDPVRIRQVLMNLIGNAIKFTATGSVSVAVGPASPDLLRFEVRDTGIGIAPENLATIFEAFTQADGSHTRRFGGTGLGLTINQRLVTLMGGRIWAESKAGRGSSFFAEIPLPACAEPAASSPVAVPEEEPEEIPALNVLVAEDNIINQKVICAMLRRQGWNVTLAGDGREAYLCYLQNQFDLILMDVQMPELDGVEATRLIRREELQGGRPRIPILAVTAHSYLSQHEQYVKAGMDAVLTKPVTLPLLRAAVAKLLHRPPNGTAPAA